MCFSFFLKIGTNYSFSMDTMETRKYDCQIQAKKKSSPSTLRKNAKRRLKFLKQKEIVMFEPEPEKETYMDFPRYLNFPMVSL